MLDGLLDTNPATSLGRARAQTSAPRHVESYSKAELGVLLADAPLVVRLLAQSGLRLGEALGLQPGDVRADHLVVERNVQWLDGDLIVQSPKNGRSRRVDIPASLALALTSNSGKTWVFEASDGQPLRPNHVRSLWYELLDRTKARRLRLHDLRHTYAAMLLTAGAPVAYVKEQLGHSSITVTVDTYGHLIPGSNRKWVDDTFAS